MSQQIISMGKTGHPLTVSKLAELLVKKLEDGTFKGNEIMADFDNTECCMMGLKKKGNLVMICYEAENEEFLSWLEREEFYNVDRCDAYDDIDEVFDAIEELENSNDDIIETVSKMETVEKLEDEKNEQKFI